MSRSSIGPVDLAIMKGRLDAITREMGNTLLRTARSTTLLNRDFSCSISTSDGSLVSAPEGFPVHVFGSSLLCDSMRELHPDLREGDAFLHNDPYLGNSHAADHTILVPVIVDGQHLFTALAKAHQADTGNCLPTTYVPTAKDVYEEGAMIFPCVAVQKDYRDVEDIIRMCRKRIRIPEIWYGDYLAMLSAGRIAERRLKEFVDRYGIETVRDFCADWLDYSETMARSAIRTLLPSGTFTGQTRLDPFPGIPDGLALQASITVDAEAGEVEVDLRQNPDCTPTGLNLSEATSKNAAIASVLTVLSSAAGSHTVPSDSGAFRVIRTLVRENCVVGIPVHPVSCSMATNTIADRVTSMIVSAFAHKQNELGAAECCMGSGPHQGVVSGSVPEPYIAQIFQGASGGPATVDEDGWLTFFRPAAAGLLSLGSVEVDEQKYPVLIAQREIRPDSEGAGRRRGAVGGITRFGPLQGSLTVKYSLDGAVNTPQGVRGGAAAQGPTACRLGPDGIEQPLQDVVGSQTLDVGDFIISRSSGGGGYGAPTDREPASVLEDLVDGYISADRARDVYGVVIRADAHSARGFVVDDAATEEQRSRLSFSPREL